MHHYHLMTDQDLVRLYQNEDEQAFAELLQRHKNKIFSIIFYLVHDRELAEDLFQDTFIRVINGLRQRHYNEEGKFISWAARIAHNTVIDYFRVQKHMRMVREQEEWSPFDAMHAVGKNPMEKMMHSEKTALVKRLIEKLPRRQREVVILRHYGGLTFKEISSTLGINMNTCLSRMHCAVKRMKQVVSGKKKIYKKRGPKTQVLVMKEKTAVKSPKDRPKKE
jgi:RNA polymerase sigma factor (sigma-70 family)